MSRRPITSSKESYMSQKAFGGLCVHRYAALEKFCDGKVHFFYFFLFFHFHIVICQGDLLHLQKSLMCPKKRSEALEL